ncbi:hypothetical protein [Arthrobacter sp. H14]|uniref:hypothetical protein n=1 Tax=Arthrobacter sp. H14 TaxID=1312959 RepID=UPI00047A0B52|nr:hypothetical protein [Arthrobacter sp. H14]
MSETTVESSTRTSHWSEGDALEVLPNGWCMLPPKQVCNRGNACLSCDKFVTDASHEPELRRQLTDTEQLVEQRKAAFLAKYGTLMSADNVWFQG